MMQERQRGSCIGRGEMWTIVHKRKDGYVNDEAKIVGVLGKEHFSRVQGVGFGSFVTQIFGHTAYRFSGISLTPLIQAKVDEMKSKLEAEKLKVKKLELVVKTERLRRQAFEGVITKYLLQQGGDLPVELAAMVNAMICILNFLISL